MNAVFFISLFCLIQVLVMCLCISWSIKSPTLSSKLFSACLAFVCVVLLRFVLLYGGVLSSYPVLIGWGMWVTLAGPPIMYFYVNSALDPNYKLGKAAWPHLLPVIAGMLCSAYMLAQDPEAKRLAVEQIMKGNPLLSIPFNGNRWAFHFVQAMFLFQLIFYIGKIRGLLEVHSQQPKERRLSRGYIKWIRLLLSGAMIFISVRVLMFFINLFVVPIPTFLFASTTITLVMFVIVSSTYFLAKNVDFSGLAFSTQKAHSTNALCSSGAESMGVKSNVEIAESDDQSCQISLTPNAQRPVETTSAKYEKDKLSEERVHSLVTRFGELMKREGCFEDSDITLARVSTELGCSPNHLSQALNTTYEKSFTNLISEMRIKEAKRLLRSQPDMPVIEVCYAVGFKSKSSFYKSFKKHTGVTPAAFKSSLDLA